jgi:hypothetical protein
MLSGMELAPGFGNFPSSSSEISRRFVEKSRGFFELSRGFVEFSREFDVFFFFLLLLLKCFLYPKLLSLSLSSSNISLYGFSLMISDSDTSSYSD